MRVILEDMQQCDFRKYVLEFFKKGIYIDESAGNIVLYEEIK